MCILALYITKTTYYWAITWYFQTIADMSLERYQICLNLLYLLLLSFYHSLMFQVVKIKLLSLFWIKVNANISVFILFYLHTSVYFYWTFHYFHLFIWFRKQRKAKEKLDKIKRKTNKNLKLILFRFIQNIDYKSSVLVLVWLSGSFDRQVAMNTTVWLNDQNSNCFINGQFIISNQIQNRIFISKVCFLHKHEILSFPFSTNTSSRFQHNYLF